MSKSTTYVAQDLIAQLRASGVAIWREGENVHYRAPSGLLTPDLLAQVKASKSELLSLLEREGSGARSQVLRAPNIVALAPGRRHPAVFCVHAIDGGVGAYSDLARELAGADVATYGIFAMDLQDRKDFPACIQAIAAKYVEQVKHIQKDGPYALVGWSSGGVIAFEMACALARARNEIAALIILDSNYLPFGPADVIVLPYGSHQLSLSPMQDQSARTWWRFLNLFSADTDATGIYPIAHEFWTMDDADKSRYVLDNVSNPRLIKPNNTLHAAKTAADILYMFRTVNTQFVALQEYRPSTYGGAVSLFITLDDLKPRAEELLRFFTGMWQKVTTGIAHAECFPGGHLAVVRHPHVMNVARHISQAL